MMVRFQIPSDAVQSNGQPGACVGGLVWAPGAVVNTKNKNVIAGLRALGCSEDGAELEPDVEQDVEPERVEVLREVRHDEKVFLTVEEVMAQGYTERYAVQTVTEREAARCGFKGIVAAQFVKKVMHDWDEEHPDAPIDIVFAMEDGNSQAAEVATDGVTAAEGEPDGKPIGDAGSSEGEVGDSVDGDDA